MAEQNENGVNKLRKIRTAYVGCSGCKQTSLKSMNDIQQASRVADDRLRLANKEHIHLMQTIKLEAGEIIKSMQAKMSAFDKNVKEINANGQRLAQSTLVHQELDSPSSSDCNYGSSGEESIKLVKERGERKHTEEIKNQDDEYKLRSLISPRGRTESDISAKIDGCEDLSERVQSLEERNDIFIETKRDHRDMVEKLESKSSELEILNKRLLKTEIDLSAKKDEVKDLSQKLKLMESQKDIIENQKRLLDSKEDQIRDIENKLRDREKRLAETMEKIEKQEQKLEKNWVKRCELDQQIEKAEAMAQEAESLSKKILILEKENEKLKQSKKDLEINQVQFESREAQIRSLENKLQEREDMLVEVSRKIDEQRREIKSNLAQLSKMEERRAKAEATAEQLMRKPLLILSSNVVTAEYPKTGMNNLICTSLNKRRKIRGKVSTSDNRVTIDTPKADSDSDLSELEVISRTANTDLEESQSEPSQIFRDADISHVVKTAEHYLRGQQEYDLFNVHSSSSSVNFGTTVLGSVEHQATRNKLILPESSATGERGYSSTSSLDEQSRSLIRGFISPQIFVQDESSTQSKVTCIKMFSSDSLSGSFIKPTCDPLNSEKSEKNVRMKAETASSVETLKDKKYSRKPDEAVEGPFKLNARIAIQEEEKGTLQKKSEQPEKCAIKTAKYKSISKNTAKPATPSAYTDTGSINVLSTEEESLDDRVLKLEKELNRRNVQLACEKDKISSLERKYENRSQAVVKLINKVGQLRKKLVARDNLIASFSKRKSGKTKDGILGAVGIMENGLNNLFDCFKICCLDIGNMVQELQKRTVDLKYYVAESCSEAFFQDYSLKSIPIKNCITGISKNFLKHQEDMYRFNRNCKDALATILPLYKLKAMNGHTRSSPESNSSKTISSSLRYHLQPSSLSSIEVPFRKQQSSFSLSQKKPYSQPQKRGRVQNELQDFPIDQIVADRETSHSATSSVFSVFTPGGRRPSKVKKRYKLKKNFGRRDRDSKDRSFSAERMHGERQVQLTPKIRAVATKKFVDADDTLFKKENHHNKTRHIKRDRKQEIKGAARPQRRRHKVKTLKQLKQSRTDTLRNALLEGLGYLATPSK